jgi:hypothetical protein
VYQVGQIELGDPFVFLGYANDEAQVGDDHSVTSLATVHDDLAKTRIAAGVASRQCVHGIPRKR